MSSSINAARSAKPHKVPKKPHRLQGGSSEANRLAVVILEVLAGGRSPGDAANALGVTPPRYYQLETRALEGLVAALEPRHVGKQPSLERRLAQLEKALSEARREGLRQQALVRAAQRSLGIKPPPVVDGKQADKEASGRKKRRPAVRALKAARTLAQNTRPPETESVQQEEPKVRPAVVALESEGAPPAAGPRLLKERQDDTSRTQTPGAPTGREPGRIPAGQATPGNNSGDDRGSADD
jgi:hypothetical protein